VIDVAELEARDRPAVRVTTVDATGAKRVYEVYLGPSEVDGASVQAGKRVAPDTEPSAPSRVFDAARDHFESDGHEVFGA